MEDRKEMSKAIKGQHERLLIEMLGVLTINAKILIIIFSNFARHSH